VHATERPSHLCGGMNGERVACLPAGLTHVRWKKRDMPDYVPRPAPVQNRERVLSPGKVSTSMIIVLFNVIAILTDKGMILREPI